MKLATPPAPPRRGPGPLSTRGGTLAVAGICTLLAAAALLLFLRQYREDLTGSEPAQVLVARSLVPKGTPGDVVASDRLYKLVKIPESKLKETAVTDPGALSDRVAVRDIYPGHQLESGDFEAADGHVGNRLSGYQRAMTVPVDAAHGMIGKIEAGDRVDVVTTSNTSVGTTAIARIAARDVLVLDVPAEAERRTEDQPATIRVTDEEAAAIAAASDGGTVWLVLRPPVGARENESADVVTDALRGGGRLKADIDISVEDER